HRRRPVRPDVEAQALPYSGEAVEQPGLRQITDPDVLARRRPAIELLTTLDLALDVEAPRRLARLEAQRLEGNLDLHGPALVRDPGHRVPDPIPIAAEALRIVRYLAVAA